MIAIKINGEFLDMPEKFKINFVKCNPLFATGFVEGDFSYSFALKLSPKNMRIFGFPQELNIYGNPILFNCELYLDNIFWTTAILTINSNTKSTVECDLVTNAGLFGKNTANKKLKELDFGNDPFIPEAQLYALYLLQGTYGSADTITFDINSGAYNYNIPFTGNLWTALGNLVNAVNLQTPMHGFVASRRRYEIRSGTEICFFYVEKPFSYTSDSVTFNIYFATGNVSNFYAPLLNQWTYQPDAAQVHILAHMKNMLDYPYYREFFTERQYCFPKMINTDFYSTNDYLSSVIYNNYNGTVGVYDINLNENLAVPFLFVKYIVERMLLDSGYRLGGSFFEDPEIATLILYNNRALGFLYYNDNEHVSDILYFEDHVSMTTCGDFLNMLKSKFSLSFKFDARKKICFIDGSKDIINSLKRKDYTNKAEPYHNSEMIVKKGFTFGFEFDSSDAYVEDYIRDLSSYTLKGAKQTTDDLPMIGNVSGDVRYVSNMNMWCYWDVNDNSWKGLAQNLMDKIIGDGETEVRVKGSPVFIRWKPYDPRAGAETKQLMAWTAQRGTHNGLNKGVDNRSIGSRLLFWRGIDQDENGEDYPLASYEPYNFNFDKNWNYSLQWETENGLINKWWKEYIRFWNSTRMVTHRMILSAHELIMLDEREKIRIDGIDYLMKEMRISFSQNGIEKIEADLYMVNMRAQIGQLYEEYPIEEEEPGGGE